MISEKCLNFVNDLFDNNESSDSFGNTDEVPLIIDITPNSTLLLCKDSETKDSIVLKAVKDLSTYNRELNALRCLSRHKSIIQLKGMTNINRHHCLYLEHFPCQSLSHYLKRFPSGLCEMDALQIFTSIVRAVGYIHESQFSHHDLKTSNILFDETKRKIKIIDFGYSIKVPQSGGELVEHAFGTPRYSSPEVLTHEAHDPRAADIWSLGIILYEMNLGRGPWDDIKTFVSLIQSIHNEIIYPISFSEKVQNILHKTLIVEPSQRVKIEELKNMMKNIKRKSEAG